MGVVDAVAGSANMDVVLSDVSQASVYRGTPMGDGGGVESIVISVAHVPFGGTISGHGCAWVWTERGQTGCCTLGCALSNTLIIHPPNLIGTEPRAVLYSECSLL